MPTPPGQRYALVSELNQEWARLVSRHRDRRPWPRRPVLDQCADLAEVIAAIRRQPDPVLAALLSEATAGDLLAARTVLQAMLGKVVRLGLGHPDLGVDDFVAALWCRIRTYPLSRRPARIAANLALDTRKDVLRAARSARTEKVAGGLGEAEWDRLLRGRNGSERAHSTAPDLRAAQVLDTAEASGLINAATSTVLRLVYLDGVDSRVAASRLGTSPGMIRYRCSRGLRALARHAGELHEAA